MRDFASLFIHVVIDQFTRRIVGFAVHPGVLNSSAVCRMFGSTVAQDGVVPTSLSSDHDPLFESHRSSARRQQVETLPEVLLSHAFVERLIGTILREFLDHVPFWTATDLERKLTDFKDYYNRAPTHRSLAGRTTIPSTKLKVAPDSIVWRSHCRGLYELPNAAYLVMRTQQAVRRMPVDWNRLDDCPRSNLCALKAYRVVNLACAYQYRGTCETCRVTCSSVKDE